MRFFLSALDLMRAPTFSPGQMLLVIPSSVLVYLRSIPFCNGDESEAFLARNVFEDIMQLISSMSSPTNEKQYKEFATKFCATIRHVLCYEAAWKSGGCALLCCLYTKGSEHNWY